jgi:P-loop Domain of unknown function (DUF2791)
VELTQRRAIEALRAGVPNRDAVRHLGTDQRAVEKRFVDALGEVGAERRGGRQLAGLLIGGDFGAGKSHLLEWLQHIALDQNFAVSKVVISKDAPLGQPHRMFRTAMHSLRLPKVVGGIEEVALQLRPDSASYAGMYQRIQDPQSGFDPLFQASLLVHERVKDAEILSKMVAFWRGEKLDMTEIRRSLKALGQPMQLKQRRIADLALPRFRFAAELLAGVGYSGWVLLLDELELVAAFSLRARAQSYATLARLLGYAPGEAVPGLYTVAAGTNDLTTILFEDRRDQERIPQRLADRLPELMPAAQAGMDLLRPSSSARMDLVPQDESALLRTYDKIRDLYETAFGWTPPNGRPDLGERSVRMRQYVRRWITQWDLMRLDPEYRPDIETHDFRPNLEEQPDLERPAEPTRDDEDS